MVQAAAAGSVVVQLWFILVCPAVQFFEVGDYGVVQLWFRLLLPLLLLLLLLLLLPPPPLLLLLLPMLLRL